MSNKEIMSNQFIGLQTSLHKLITRINGDDWTVGLKEEIQLALKSIDKNSESKNINPIHFDKLIVLSKEAVGTITKYSEYISNLNLRYTGGKNVNINLLNEMLNDFSMQVNTIPLDLKDLKPTENKEDTRNGAELIKDNVI
tara:strand:+ start:2762 stop:3184 length:423 start_codon:yes stop_codon:yes gene_type:complete